MSNEYEHRDPTCITADIAAWDTRRAHDLADLLDELARAVEERDEHLNDYVDIVAAIDRLVHHATILEMNVESYRRREAADRLKKADAAPTTTADNLARTPPPERQPQRPSPANLAVAFGHRG